MLEARAWRKGDNIKRELDNVAKDVGIPSDKRNPWRVRVGSLDS